MNTLHGTLAVVAAVGVAAFLIAAALTAVGILRTRLWLDRVILAQAATGLAAGLAGLGAALTRPPTDVLHILYGALIALGPLVARMLVPSQTTRRLGRSLTLVGLVLVGILVRAFMTGD